MLQVLAHKFKFRHCFPSNLFCRYQLCLFFHHYVPVEPVKIQPDVHDSNCPNLLKHKDWLSQPQVIRIFQSLRNPNFALPVFDQLSKRKDYNPSEQIYITVINKLALAKNFDAIETLMERIKLERKCRLSDGFFRSVIKIYGHGASRINKAIETLFDMPNYKCWPSVETFNFVLNLLVTTKQFEIVHEVYGKASELGVEIDACCLNIMIKGLCECGEIDAAYKVLDEFPKQKCSPTARTFSTIMHGLCSRGRVGEAFGLLEKMEMEKAVEIDAIVFNILISGLRKLGRIEEGIGLYETMMAKGCNPNPATYQEVLYCLLDGKRFVEAKSFMERMINKKINMSFDSYKLVIRGFCSENLVEDVEWALKQMMEHGFVPKMGLWNEIVSCLLSDEHRVISMDHYE